MLRNVLLLIPTLIYIAALGRFSAASDYAQALASAKRATAFLTNQVAERGGYLWKYSADLKLREGEGIVNSPTVWVQPPGTPSVGNAFVELYKASGDLQFLFAARQAADALRLGQMRSGGWQASVEFEPDNRREWAYRSQPISEKAKDQSSLDDDTTQSALRFLINLDDACEHSDPTVHEMVIYGLSGLLNKGQLSCGGFPQVWTQTKLDPPTEVRHASFPDSWDHEYSGHNQYWYRPTLNDDLAPAVLQTLLLAHTTYADEKYLDAARRLGDFLISAQLPAPQPAWAQQYSFDLKPIWARKFEPPAVTGGESQGAIETLLGIYEATGETKYLKPIPAALEYLSASALPDGRLARFYELRTNRPLYLTRQYEITYDSSDLPTHYSFQVGNRVAKMKRRYSEIVSPKTDIDATRTTSQSSRVDQSTIARLLERQDERGAWISPTPLKYHKIAGPTISMQETVNNLLSLAAFLEQSRPDDAD